MTWLRALSLGAGLVAFAGGSARAADASGPDEVSLAVTVLQVSDQPGESDPRCERFEKLLRGQVAYGSLSVVDIHHRVVPVDEVWSLELPTERTLQLRPLDVNRETGTLLSLDVEEGMQGDFRVRSGQPLVIGGPRLGEGRLIVVVEYEMSGEPPRGLEGSDPSQKKDQIF